MIDEYVDCVEIKRLIEESKIKSAAVRKFYQKRGILLNFAKPDLLARKVFTTFLGCDSVEKLRQAIISDVNYEKSVVFEIVCDKKKEDCSMTAIEYMTDELQRCKTEGVDGLLIDRPILYDDGLKLNISYDKKIPGRNRLIQNERRSIAINIRTVEDNVLLVDIRQKSSDDYKKILDLFNAIRNEESDDYNVDISHLNIKMLPQQDRVKFFDKIGAVNDSRWRLKTISGITVKKHSDSGNDISDEEEHDSEQFLDGITQAILNGAGLRTNSFVQECLQKGFDVVAMKYRFESKNSDFDFIIDINAKNEDLHVSVEKSFFMVDGKYCVQPLEKAMQDEIVRDFQSKVVNIFSEINNSSKKLTIEIQDKKM